MKSFMDQNFLLSTPTAQKLYHEVASKLPIIDYHCHINPKEIAKDKVFETITEVWLGGDHYKWRLMRSNGIDEHYITGDATPFQKFEKWAKTLEHAIGNPLYHWSHLELQRYFDYQRPLTEKTAKEAFDWCNKKLQDSNFSVRNLIKRSNVTLLCTTDDPIDSLIWHKAIKDDTSFEVQVLPTWRPDMAMNLEKETYLDYLEQLATISGETISTFSSLKEALIKRLDHFQAHGCKLSDHGVDYVCYTPYTDEEIETIFAQRQNGILPTTEEISKFKTAFLVFMGQEYHKRDWTMQLHFGCKRNNNTRQFKQLGADTGYDCINNYAPAALTADFLNALALNDRLPKTILYSLNPNDNAYIGTILGCFQSPTTVGKIQHGSAWWFNDHKTGMIEQMTSLANLGLLCNFVGMLTDSRSFLSYTRHEYFRRILCDLIGNWVENGEYPDDDELLFPIIKGICYENAQNYFEF